MKVKTILTILIILNFPIIGQEVSISTEEQKMYKTSVKNKEAGRLEKSGKEIMDQIIDAGGKIIYSVYSDSSMISHIENDNLRWPHKYSDASSFICHYYLNDYLCFKIIFPGVENNKMQVVSCSLIDIKCDGDNIFSCTYLCIDDENGDTIGIASDLDEQELIILVNNATENISLAMKARPEEITRY